MVVLAPSFSHWPSCLGHVFAPALLAKVAMQILREKFLAMSKSKGAMGVLGCETWLCTLDACCVPFEDVAAALSYGIQMMSLDSFLGRTTFFVQSPYAAASRFAYFAMLLVMVYEIGFLGTASLVRDSVRLFLSLLFGCSVAYFLLMRYKRRQALFDRVSAKRSGSGQGDR